MPQPKTRRVETRITPMIEAMLIHIAIKEYDGSVSKYLRDLILSDLVIRDAIDKLTAQTVKEVLE